MTRKPRGLTRQMEQLIESALAPGRFIPYNANYDFVGDLEAAEKQIASLVPTEPELTVSLYETFLAGCYEKAGLVADWQSVVSKVRSEHHRKMGFMSGFEEIAAGSGPSEKPSFIERAKARWGSRRSEGGP